MRRTVTLIARWGFAHAILQISNPEAVLRAYNLHELLADLLECAPKIKKDESGLDELL